MELHLKIITKIHVNNKLNKQDNETTTSRTTSATTPTTSSASSTTTTTTTTTTSCCCYWSLKDHDWKQLIGTLFKGLVIPLDTTSPPVGPKLIEEKHAQLDWKLLVKLDPFPK